MKKIIILSLSILISKNALAQSDVIQKWDEQVADKGYILSLDLYNNKKCSHIWTKQIKAFLKENPNVKDANLILINQKIKVQDCKMVIQSEPPINIPSPVAVEVKAKNSEWFVGAFTGLSKLGGKDDDTAKEGYSIGLKIGQLKKIPDGKKISLALGIIQNKSQTIDNNNILGSYEVKSILFTGEAAYLYPLGKMALGPKAMLVAGDDTSFKERGLKESLGLYLGVSGLARITKHLDFEIDFQQKVEDRLNILGNIGLRFNF